MSKATKELKSSFSNTIFLMSASILSIPLMAVSEILQGRYMTVISFEEYASFAYAIVFISLLSGICFNWINISFFRLAKDDLFKLDSVSVYNFYYILFGLAKLFIIFTAFYGFTEYIRSTLNIPIQLSNLQIVSILLIAFLKNFFLSLLKTLNHLKTVATIQKLFQKFLFACMVLLLFLYFQRLDYSMMIQVYILNEILTLLVLFVTTPKKYIRFSIKFGEKFLVFMKISLTNYFAVISLSFVANIDLIIINMYLSAEMVANYNAAYKIFNLIKATISGNLFTVFMPVVVAFHIKKEEYKVNQLFYKTIGKQLALLFLFGFIIVSPFAEVLISLMYENKFSHAAYILHILLVVSYISSIHFSTNIINDVYLIVKERTLISIIGAVINILFDLVLIRIFGVIGAAYATLFVVYFQTSLFQIVIKKRFDIFNVYLTVLPIIYLVYTIILLEINNIELKLVTSAVFCFGILIFSIKSKFFLKSELELFNNIKLPHFVHLLLKNIYRFSHE